jgi:prepilin-type N-terminal cleavage/methylation domain-containing protein
MNKKLRKNNKGFSLVELIVVMAIMAILAVTLAPRLSQYIDKARQANDRETANAVYTAIKLGMMDDKIFDDVATASTDSTPPYEIKLRYNSGSNTNGIYNVAGEQWTARSATSTNKFLNQILEVMGSFKLQSDLAGNNSDIIVTVTSETMFSVILDYDGNTTTITDQYEVNSDEVAID